MRVFKGIENLPTFHNSVLTIGTYDGVHIGHQVIIQKINQLAKEINGESVVLTFDPHPRIVLQPNNPDLKLISTIEEKIELLESFGLENLVITPFSKDFASMEAEEYVRDFLIKNFHPSIIVIGYDHRFGKGRKGDIQLLRELAPIYGYQVQEISVQTIDEISVSSTKVRTALMESKIQEANKWLAHPFTLQGKVVHGDKIGRTLGFPTANVQVEDPYKLIPPIGVYAVWVEINGDKHKGALSISYRPTVTSSGEKRIEVYILDFNQDLYGQELKIIFVDHIRDDKKFDSLELLKDKIREDIEKVKFTLDQQ